MLLVLRNGLARPLLTIRRVLFRSPRGLCAAQMNDDVKGDATCQDQEYVFGMFDPVLFVF